MKTDADEPCLHSGRYGARSLPVWGFRVEGLGLREAGRILLYEQESCMGVGGPIQRSMSFSRLHNLIIASEGAPFITKARLGDIVGVLRPKTRKTLNGVRSSTAEAEESNLLAALSL